MEFIFWKPFYIYIIVFTIPFLRLSQRKQNPYNHYIYSNYKGSFSLMPSSGIEPETRGFSVLCSTNWANWAWIAGTGFEPMTFGLWARRASRLLHPAIYSIFNKTEWAEVDSNHRSNLQQIYSLSPLATRESAHFTIYYCVSRWSDSNR